MSNIPILPMAFLTFAEAKVVAPPILPRKYLAHAAQIIKGSPLRFGINLSYYYWTSIEIMNWSGKLTNIVEGQQGGVFNKGCHN